jgi:hypothetical protein
MKNIEIRKEQKKKKKKEKEGFLRPGGDFVAPGNKGSESVCVRERARERERERKKKREIEREEVCNRETPI